MTESKRLRFDTSALSPSDKAATPMGTAKEAIKDAVVLLQPEMATILSRLGTEFLLCLHRENSKSSQLKKLEDDPKYVLISTS